MTQTWKIEEKEESVIVSIENPKVSLPYKEKVRSKLEALHILSRSIQREIIKEAGKI